jgi:hypothetical protein
MEYSDIIIVETKSIVTEKMEAEVVQSWREYRRFAPPTRTFLKYMWIYNCEQ